MRAIMSYGLALLIILGVAAWLGTGTLVTGGNGPGNGVRPVVTLFEEEHGPISTALESSGLQAHHEEGATHIDPHLTIAERLAESSGESAPARSVRTQTFTVQPMAIEVPLRGRTKAKASVNVMAETQGIVETVHVQKGQRVAQGDLLCTIDKGTRAAAVAQAQASFAQAEAGLVQAQADFDTNAELRGKGIAAANTARPFEVQLAAAKASVTAAQAALDNAQAELGRTEVRAPVSGIVQDPLITVGSMLGAQAPCATVVELNPMLFTGNVPEARIGLARLGLDATIKTVTGQEATGKVTYIASTADAATRSFPVDIEIPNADGALRDGVTAEAIVNVGTAPVHILPQSVLTLDDEGTIGVRVVEDSKVVFYPVTITRDTREGVWVTGLPPRIEVITVGQEFVQPGQVVNATNVSAAAAEAEGV